jgi:hypothetical protein
LIASHIYCIDVFGVIVGYKVICNWIVKEMQSFGTGVFNFGTIFFVAIWIGFYREIHDRSFRERRLQTENGSVYTIWNVY